MHVKPMDDKGAQAVKLRLLSRFPDLASYPEDKMDEFCTAVADAVRQTVKDDRCRL